MYDIPDARQERGFERGTSLLLAGPEDAVRSFAADAVERGVAAGEGTVLVLADDDATLPDLDGAAGPVGVVDCRADGGPVPDGAVVRSPDPGDLATTGVAVSELLATFRGPRDSDRNRVLVDSTAGLLAGGEEGAFRFLHVLAGRIGNANALGLVVHRGDDRRASTLRPVFDGVVTVAPGGDPEFAAAGSR